MMCNPNTPMPDGSNQNGSPTGKQLPPGSNLLCDRIELFEKSAQEIHRRISRLRDSWLGNELLARGFPRVLLDGVREREPGSLQLAAHWVQLHGYTVRYELLNTIELFQHGESVAFAKLFDMPLWTRCPE
jgi:hypothetical protein